MAIRHSPSTAPSLLDQSLINIDLPLAATGLRRLQVILIRLSDFVPKYSNRTKHGMAAVN